MGRIDDARLASGPRIRADQLRALGLPYFAREVAEGYFTTDVLSLSGDDTDRYAAFAKTAYALYEAAVGDVLRGEYREEFGLTEELWALAARTWRERVRHPHALCRFDVAGVIDGEPARLIELNADTATVLAEAALVQPLQAGGGTQWNDILDALADQLASLALELPPEERDVLVVTLGDPEDDDSALVWRRAAEAVGLRCELAHLPSVHFAPGEGVFRRLNGEEWVRYGIFVKLVPWDWIALEEPGLLADLSQLILRDGLAVINPPHTALMQSKAMLAELSRRYPDHPAIPAAGWGGRRGGAGGYVTKPLFGREGENVHAYAPDGSLLAEAPGDYALQPRIWQRFVELPCDGDGDVYQAGVYWAGGACGVGLRRRDGLIVDREAEFVSHVVIEPRGYLRPHAPS